MKKTILLLLITSLLFTACSGEKKSKRSADLLPPMEITIPDEIKDDTELVELVKSSEKAINEVSDNFEKIIVDFEEYFDDDFNMEEAGMTDKIKIGKVMIDVVTNSTSMLTTMEKFNNYVENKKELGDFNESQIKAVEHVGEAFKNRMQEIETKYKKILDK